MYPVALGNTWISTDCAQNLPRHSLSCIYTGRAPWLYVAECRGVREQLLLGFLVEIQMMRSWCDPDVIPSSDWVSVMLLVVMQMCHERWRLWTLSTPMEPQGTRTMATPCSSSTLHSSIWTRMGSSTLGKPSGVCMNGSMAHFIHVVVIFRVFLHSISVNPLRFRSIS